MSLYFFHLRDGVDVLLDPEGRELDSMTAIAAAALADARSIIGDDALRGRIDLDQRIDVEDTDGKLVHRLEFEDAVEIVRGNSREA